MYGSFQEFLRSINRVHRLGVEYSVMIEDLKHETRRELSGTVAEGYSDTTHEQKSLSKRYTNRLGQMIPSFK